MSDPVLEQPGAETEVEQPLSIMEHASQFGPEAQREAATDDADTEGMTPEQKSHHSAEQKRERETGKFREGKVRHRAKSQQASPEDVPRIQALTGRAKAAEDRATALEAEVTRLRAQHAPPAQIAKAEARADQAQTVAHPQGDPEPREDDPKFAGDYGKYLRAAAAWDVRQEQRQARANFEAHQRRQQVEQANQQTLKSFTERVTAAKGKYADFEAVAFAPTRIPPQSAVDVWIMDDDNGPDVLYHLQSHPEELDEILGLPVLTQVKRLALLSQRFAEPPSQSAAATRSATGRQSIVLPPPPANLVRTGAQRVSDGPPPTDGSLSIAEHQRRFGKRK